jgi:two-component system NtrC family sensor kinase
MEHARHYQPIKISILLYVVLVSITPLVLIMTIAGYSFHTAYRDKVEVQLVQLVEKHRQTVNSFLNEKGADIRVIAHSLSFAQLSDDSALAGILATLQEQHAGVFVDLGLVNQKGEQVAYAGSFKLARADYSTADWFKQAKGREFYLSDVFLGLRGLPHFIVAVRVPFAGQNYILRATIDFVAFNELVENISVGETGLAFIINSRGEFQTKPRVDLSSEVPAILDLIKKNIDLAKERAKAAESVAVPAYKSQERLPVHFFTHRPDKGSSVISVMTPLKGGDWVLVFQQEEREALARLYQTRMVLAAVFLLGALAIIAMAFLLSRRVISRIAQVDTEKEMMNERVIEAGKLASLGELAAGIAHEINNPVAIMVEESGWIGDLLEEKEFGDTDNIREIRRALAQIRTQGGRCKEITHKLLSFARKTDPTETEVDPNALAEEVVGLSEQRAKFAQVKVEAALADGLPRIRASASEMQQVLLNLLNNAMDAMDKKQGGKITISTRFADGMVVFDVADTGMGIPEANLQRIFDPFFTTKPVGKGTGLGLSICYGIIRKMGGKITVNSAVGQGTCFHIHVPVSEQKGRPETSLV